MLKTYVRNWIQTFCLYAKNLLHVHSFNRFWSHFLARGANLLWYFSIHRKRGMCPNFQCNHELQIFGCNQKYKGLCGVLCGICWYIYTKRYVSHLPRQFISQPQVRVPLGALQLFPELKPETWTSTHRWLWIWNPLTPLELSNLWHTYSDSSGSACFLSFLELRWGYISFSFRDMWVWEYYNSGRGAWMSACHSFRYLEIIKFELLQMLPITNFRCHFSLLRGNKS